MNGTLGFKFMLEERDEQIGKLQDIIDDLITNLNLAIDFHGADTLSFVEKYGHGIGTREMCDRLRLAITEAGNAR